MSKDEDAQGEFWAGQGEEDQGSFFAAGDDLNDDAAIDVSAADAAGDHDAWPSTDEEEDDAISESVPLTYGGAALALVVFVFYMLSGDVRMEEEEVAPTLQPNAVAGVPEAALLNKPVPTPNAKTESAESQLQARSTINVDNDAGVGGDDDAVGASAVGVDDDAGGASAVGMDDPNDDAGGASAVGMDDVPDDDAGGASAVGMDDDAGGATAAGASVGTKIGGVEPSRLRFVRSPLNDDEAYTLALSASGVAQVMSKALVGALRGAETLMQLLGREGGGRGLLAPPGARTPLTVRDAPRFRWRGLLLDTGRHYYPIQDIVRLLHGMSASKLNVLHLHLTDAQSFPLDLGIAGQHGGGAFSPHKRYAAADLRLLVQTATALGITVVPEIDVPAHSAAWAQEFGAEVVAQCPKHIARSNIDSHGAGAINVAALNPLSDRMWTVLEKVLHAITDIFPSRFVHTGGDEVNFQCWEEDASVRAWMRAQRKSARDVLQLFEDRVVASLGTRNRTSVVWQGTPDEGVRLPRGGASRRGGKGAVVELWKAWAQLSDSAMQRAQQNKNDVLVASAFYLDWGSKWSDFYLSKASLRRGLQDTFLGGEACMWSEHVDTTNLDCRVWPRAAAVAEVLCCKTDLDCSLNGVCDAATGACACDAPWKDGASGREACNVLDTLPHPEGYVPAYGGPRTDTSWHAQALTSWGGNILRGEDGLYHMFVSAMGGGRGLGSWRTNSQIDHAVAADPMAVFVKNDTALGAQAHNASPLRAPNGTWLLFHIGTAGAAPGTGSSFLHAAESPAGPWRPLRGPTPFCNNPAPMFHNNGTAYVGCRSTHSSFKVYRSDDVFGGKWARVTTMKFPPSWSGDTPELKNEDPYLWMDVRGGWHFLAHRYDTRDGWPVNPNQTEPVLVSGHGYSRDGIDWRFNVAEQPYDAVVRFANGTVQKFSTFERPQLLFDAKTGRATHLVNGVHAYWQPPGAAGPCDKCSARPGSAHSCVVCKVTPGIDYTYTLVTKLNTPPAANDAPRNRNSSDSAGKT
eukprot:g578.t1